MFFLELTTGMRKSELAALQWSDLDRKQQTVSVSKQVCKVDGKLTAVPPKTVNSVRKIALPDETMAMLRTQRENFPESDCIFPSPLTGEMYHLDSVADLHKKTLKEAGLEHIRLHELRHRLVGDGPLLSLRAISPASPGESPSRPWPYRTAWT